MHELLPMNINFYVKKISKISHLVNKIQFIDQIAIKKHKTAFIYKSSHSVKQFP